MEADPLEIAREAVALAEKATKGPWFVYGGSVAIEECHPVDGPYPSPLCDGYERDLPLIAHAGTHYGTLAQALIAKHAEVGRLREALMVLEDNAGDMAERAGSSADAAAFRCLVEIARAALAQEAGK